MDLDAWLEMLREAWKDGKTEHVPTLFEGCESYWESPWQEVPAGDIMSVWGELAGKKARKLDLDILCREGDKAVVGWSYTDHKDEDSAGVLWLRFEDGKCKELRMWWMSRE